ncbi:MAG: DegV family protein [Candidatus Promineofilum sp.]|nr:DegV family protein [Promineifilum sp.]MCW5864367.1 DegV family protein [Anaerolineae bacterium]
MVKIITDTTACLSPEIARRYDIPVIPQIVHFGEETFYEGVDMDAEAFMNRLKASAALPKTAAPPPELFVEQFRRWAPLGEPIVCLHPSAEISGTIRSVTVAAAEFPDADIRIVDTRLVASPLGTIVQLAAEAAVRGADADAIVALANDLSRRGRIYFLVSTLEYLARGGRIGGASALVGSLLSVKPILQLQDGRIEQYERERTQKRALARLKEIVREQIPGDGRGYLSILYAGNPEEGRALADDLGRAINQPDVPVVSMPPAIITHGGPGLLGAAFFVANA